MNCTFFEQYLSNENHSQQNNLNYFQISFKINDLGSRKVLDKAFEVPYNIHINNKKRIKTMKYILSDIKRGHKINTLLKNHRCEGISVNVILYCMRLIQTSQGRTC